MTICRFPGYKSKVGDPFTYEMNSTSELDQLFFVQPKDFIVNITLALDIIDENPVSIFPKHVKRFQSDFSHFFFCYKLQLSEEELSNFNGDDAASVTLDFAFMEEQTDDILPTYMITLHPPDEEFLAGACSYDDDVGVSRISVSSGSVVMATIQSTYHWKMRHCAVDNEALTSCFKRNLDSEFGNHCNEVQENSPGENCSWSLMQTRGMKLMEYQIKSIEAVHKMTSKRRCCFFIYVSF